MTMLNACAEAHAFAPLRFAHAVEMWYFGGFASKSPTVKDESFGLVSVLRLKVLRLSVLSRSRTKFWNLSRLGLVSDENFWDSLVPVSSRWFNFYLVMSRSRPDLDE